MLADIASVVGGQVISADTGLTFENATLSMLGKAARVVATKDTTVFVGEKGKEGRYCRTCGTASGTCRQHHL